MGNKKRYRKVKKHIAKLGGIKIEMVQSVHHLGNYFDCTFNEQTVKLRKVNL